MTVVVNRNKSIDYESHQLWSEAGLMTHDYVRCTTNPATKKAVLVLPGANSDIEMNHIRAIVR